MFNGTTETLSQQFPAVNNKVGLDNAPAVEFDLPLDKPKARDFCTVPRRVRFRSEPRVLVRIERTTRRHTLARAVVTLVEEGFEAVSLGDFVILEQAGKVVVAGPSSLRCNYRLGKRIEQEILAAFHEWQERRHYSR